jgi:cytosine/adenosine deaminase-related metal-dependent hydrolase
VAPGSVTNVDAEFLDAARRLVVPGLINAHTHSHGGLSKGVGDLWSLELLLNAAPWIGGSRSAEDKYLAAVINVIEHVEKGSTALGCSPARERTADEPADRLRLGIAPTIPQHCTREFMIGCRDIAREHNVAMQSHVSEPRYLSASSFRFAGMSMTETMDACGIVGPWFSAAHAVWINDKDMALLAGKGAQVALNLLTWGSRSAARTASDSRRIGAHISAGEPKILTSIASCAGSLRWKRRPRPSSAKARRSTM